VAAPRGEIDEIVRAYWDAGIRHIVAFARRHAGHERAPIAPIPMVTVPPPELIAGIKKVAPFEVSVSFIPSVIRIRPATAMTSNC
jgi:methylenetetrahydrofolate reductase (NADPH)